MRNGHLSGTLISTGFALVVIGCSRTNEKKSEAHANAVESLKYEITVHNDSIRGLPGIPAFAPKGIDSLAVEGWLGEQKPDFLVLSGAETGDGDYVGPVLHILRPGQEIVWGVNGTPVPEYPGALKDSRDSIIMVSRAFVGQCLDTSRSLVELIRYRRSAEYGPWRDSTHVWKSEGSSLVESAMSDTSSTRDILRRVVEGQCHEIRKKDHYTPGDDVD